MAPRSQGHTGSPSPWPGLTQVCLLPPTSSESRPHTHKLRAEPLQGPQAAARLRSDLRKGRPFYETPSEACRGPPSVPPCAPHASPLTRSGGICSRLCLGLAWARGLSSYVGRRMNVVTQRLHLCPHLCHHVSQACVLVLQPLDLTGGKTLTRFSFVAPQEQLSKQRDMVTAMKGPRLHPPLPLPSFSCTPPGGPDLPTPSPVLPWAEAFLSWQKYEKSLFF